MSDKSELEVIRAVKRYDVRDENLYMPERDLTKARLWKRVVLASDFDRLLSHIDALEARVAQLEGALHEIQFGELQCDYCQENMRIARAALAQVKP